MSSTAAPIAAQADRYIREQDRLSAPTPADMWCAAYTQDAAMKLDPETFYALVGRVCDDENLGANAREEARQDLRALLKERLDVYGRDE